MGLPTNLDWIPIAYLRDAKVLLFLLLLAAFPLLGYQFGGGNQVEQFAIIARMINPDFATGDFYIDNAIGFGPRFYYSKFMAVFVGATSFPITVFVLSLIFNFATGVVTFLSARRFLNASAVAGAMAAILAVTNSGFALGLAGYIRFDSFQPASIAIPISLTGLYLLFSGRLMIAAPAFAIASLFHPLIGLETGLVSFGAFFLAKVFSQKMSRKMMRELVRHVAAGVIFIALVFAAWGVPSLMSAAEKIPDQEFFDTLITFRSPHHYLALGFPHTHYVSFILFCIGAGAVMIHYARADGLTHANKSLIIAAVAILILCAASVVFVDILQSRLYATAQVFRMLFLVKWIGYLFIGWLAARLIADPSPVNWVFAALLLVGVSEAQSRTLILILSLCWASAHTIFSQKKILKWGLAAIAIAGAIYFHHKFGTSVDAMRAIAATSVAFLIFKFPINERAAMAAATALTAFLILFIMINRTEHWIERRSLTPKVDWADLSGHDVDMARWVRTNTPQGGIWSTPPDFESFRVVAERGIIVDFTSIPFDNLALREWKKRTETLYGPVDGSSFWALGIMKKNYAQWDTEKLRAVMIGYDADYAVLYNSTPWDGAILYQNGTYKAVQR